MTLQYRSMLDIADDLAGYQRYLSPQEEAQLGKVESAFAGERRAFVYELIKQPGSLDEHLARIDRDLERIEATGNHSGFAIEHVRQELHRNIEKQLGSSTFVRLATRWGPPLATGAAVLAYFYFKVMQ